MSKQTRGSLWALSLALCVALLLFLSAFARGEPADTLQVAYIDVGQGDSIWLHATDGTDVLIDGGPRSAGPAVVTYLQNGSIDDIEVVVLTHGDADHVGGLIDVLRSTIPVEAVVYNGQHASSSTYADFLAELQDRSLTPTPAQAGQTHTWGPLSAATLNPQALPTGDQNEDSVVLRIAYGDVRLLFTGDIGSTTEQTILLSDTLRAWTAAEVLKVAHHGSKYSSSASFLEALGADLAVISVGASNPYGHPAPETLDRLRAAGARVLRTDQRGTVVVFTNGQVVRVEGDSYVFLPLVMRSGLAPATTGDIRITAIFYDGVVSPQEPDEYVAIRNDDTQPIQMSNWTLRDEANHVFTFPAYVMQPGQVCRVYTTRSIRSGAASTTGMARPSGATVGTARTCGIARERPSTRTAIEAPTEIQFSPGQPLREM